MKKHFRLGVVCMISALVVMPVAAVLRSTTYLALAGQILVGFGMVLEAVGLVLVILSFRRGKTS